MLAHWSIFLEPDFSEFDADWLLVIGGRLFIGSDSKARKAVIGCLSDGAFSLANMTLSSCRPFPMFF